MGFRAGHRTGDRAGPAREHARGPDGAPDRHGMGRRDREIPSVALAGVPAESRGTGPGGRKVRPGTYPRTSSGLFGVSRALSAPQSSRAPPLVGGHGGGVASILDVVDPLAAVRSV